MKQWDSIAVDQQVQIEMKQEIRLKVQHLYGSSDVDVNDLGVSAAQSNTKLSADTKTMFCFLF